MASSGTDRLETGGNGFNLLAAQRAVFKSRLSSAEKLVALALLDHWSQRNPVPFPSMRTLGMNTSLCERQVRRTVRSLVHAGALEARDRPGRTKEYELGNLLMLEPAQQDARPRATPALHAGRHSMPPPPARDAALPRHHVPTKEPREGTHEGTQLRLASAGGCLSGRPPHRAGVPKSAKRPMPDGWLPERCESTKRAEAKATQAGADLERELRRFSDHHLKQGSAFASWNAAWRTWLDKFLDITADGQRRPDGARNSNNRANGADHRARSFDEAMAGFT